MGYTIGIKKGSIPLESIDKKYYRLLAMYVILDTSGAFSFFLSIKMMDPAIVSFLNQAQIIFTLFLGYILLNEELIKEEIVAAVFIIVGIFIMTFNSASASSMGILLMLYANFTGAVALVTVRKIGSHVGTLTFARIRTISLFVVFFSYNLYKTGKVEILPIPLILTILLGSFFGPFLNVISIYKSLEYIPAGKLALFRSVQPLFVMVAAGIFLKTFPGFRELIGGLIIIFGSVILAYYHINHVIGVKRPLRALR
jgi:drug/metabolite transporter (DMT)-like permease